jgi:hypothetical protein
MNRLYLLAAIACMVLPGAFCTRQATDIAGGSTSTNNARVAGIVYDNDGTPSANAMVLLRDIVVTATGDSLRNEWRSTTNHAGDYFFDSIPRGNYALVSYDDEMRFSDFHGRFEIAGDTIASLSLSKLYVLKGRILADSAIDKQSIVVSATGIARPVHPDAQGFYTLSGVSRSRYDLLFVHGSVANYLPVELLACTKDTLYVRDAYFTNNNTSPYSYFATTLSASYAIEPVVYPAGSEPAWYSGTDFSFVRYFSTEGITLHEISSQGLPSILVDDFDSGDSVSVLSAITGKAFWYAYTDKTLFNGNSIVLPEGATTDFSLALSDSAAFSGKSVRITAILGHAYRAPYAGVAINVEPKGSSAADFSSMQSFSFMLKGKGQIRVIFWSRLATTAYPDSQTWGQFGSTVQCPSAWTRTVILPQDIATPVGSKQNADSLKWTDASTNIFRIEFSTWQNPTDTIQMGIDQVYINGVSESVFQ